MKLADVMAAASAPVGASFTFLALVTGALWGKPMWGTYWVWDARLTSELILLFLYLGIMALLLVGMPLKYLVGVAGLTAGKVGLMLFPLLVREVASLIRMQC